MLTANQKKKNVLFKCSLVSLLGCLQEALKSLQGSGAMEKPTSDGGWVIASLGLPKWAEGGLASRSTFPQHLFASV